MEEMKRTSLGIQTFERLITEDRLYIDKTEYIYKMVIESSFYFLSRPRRFGKSLTLSTLAALFEGKKELFRGLAIYDKNWDWHPWPIIRFDFSLFSEEQTAEELKSLIKGILRDTVTTNNLEIDETLPYNRYFSDVLKKMPRQAVILIDEYDKPILNNLSDKKKIKEIQEILKGFYIVIKSQESYVKFVFLTGVSKFAKINLFSGLNNLIDMTMKPEWAGLCGYTEEDMDKYFTNDFPEIAHEMDLSVVELRNRIKQWYNGFRFSPSALRVYNPVSIMNFMSDRIFAAYWFETGTPTFLIEQLKKHNFNLGSLENTICPETSFSSFDIEKLLPLPLLQQTGYLTITDYDKEFGYYTLSPPNQEVKRSLYEVLLHEYMDEPMADAPAFLLLQAIRSHDIEQFLDNIEIIFAGIPYDVHLPYEKYWQSLFYLVFSLMGYFIEVEYRTNRGRIDAVIQTPESIYIFEFKFTDSDNAPTLLKEASEQIGNNEYARRFELSEKSIHLIPAVFCYKDRKCTVLR